MNDSLDSLYREESRRVFSSLLRLPGSFDIAEEALHHAFMAAAEQMAQSGHAGESRRLAGVDRPFQGH